MIFSCVCSTCSCVFRTVDVLAVQSGASPQDARSRPYYRSWVSVQVEILCCWCAARSPPRTPTERKSHLNTYTRLRGYCWVERSCFTLRGICLLFCFLWGAEGVCLGAPRARVRIVLGREVAAQNLQQTIGYHRTL